MRDETTDRGAAQWQGATVLFRAGALGDFVLTLPLLEALAQRAGTAGLTLCGLPAHGELATAGGWIRELWRIEAARWAPLWGGGALDAVARRLAGVDTAVVVRPVGDDVLERIRACGVARVLHHDPRPPDDGSVHAADHLRAALGGVATGGPSAPAIPRLPLPAAARSDAERRLAPIDSARRRRLVAVMPGAGGELKRWPAERFVALARVLAADGWQPLWLTGPVEAGRGRRIAPRDPWIQDAGPLATAALLARCRVAVGNDTGTAHLAGAVGTPVVALFGPTDERTWGPRGGPVEVLRDPRFGPRCAVCPAPCAGTHPAPCLEALAVDRVAAAVRRLAGAPADGDNA